jgi:RHS repeat-associated protein
MFSNYQIIPTSKILIGSKLLEKKEFANNEGLNWYNYHVRLYDPQIGRWHNPDILAETSIYVSSYAYCDANPVNYTDPSGMKKQPPRERIEYPQQSSNFDWSGGAGRRGGFGSGGGGGGLNGAWGGYGNYFNFRMIWGQNISYQNFSFEFENGELSKINNLALTKKEPKKTYSGRTSGVGPPEIIAWVRYRYHHINLIWGHDFERVDKSYSGDNAYSAIRGREQQLIDRFGGVGSPMVGNSIRSVAYLNPLCVKYGEASNKEFGSFSKCNYFIK